MIKKLSIFLLFFAILSSFNNTFASSKPFTTEELTILKNFFDAKEEASSTMKKLLNAFVTENEISPQDRNRVAEEVRADFSEKGSNIFFTIAGLELCSNIRSDLNGANYQPRPENATDVFSPRRVLYEVSRIEGILRRDDNK